MLRHQYAGLTNSGAEAPLSRSSALQLSWRQKAQERSSISGHNSCCYLNSSHVDNVSVNRWSPMTFEDDDLLHLPHQANGLRRSSSASKRLKNCVFGSAPRSDSAATVLIGSDQTKMDNRLKPDPLLKNDCSVAPFSFQGALPASIAKCSTNLAAIILTLIVLGLPSAIVAILSLMLYLHVASETYTRETSSEDIDIIDSRRSGANIYTQLRGPSLSDRTLLDLASALCAVSLSMALCAAFSAITECYVILKSVQAHGSRTPGQIHGMRRFRCQSIYLRFISHGGFFLSVPLFLLAVIVHWQVQFSISYDFTRTVTSTVTTVLISVPLLLCLACMSFAVYSVSCGPLKLRTNRKNQGAPITAVGRLAAPGKKLVFDEDFSTLV